MFLPSCYPSQKKCPPPSHHIGQDSLALPTSTLNNKTDEFDNLITNSATTLLLYSKMTYSSLILQKKKKKKKKKKKVIHIQSHLSEKHNTTHKKCQAKVDEVLEKKKK